MQAILQNKTSQILVVLIGVFVITMLLEFILTHIKAENSRIQTGITLLKSLTKYVGALIAMIWILAILGVDVNTIFASVGILALVVGFSAESLIADLITGIFMLFENQFNVGDVVEINRYRGTVKEIGIRTISILDSGNNVKIINNSQIHDLINLSQDSSTVVCDVNISYENSLKDVEELLQNIIENIQKDHGTLFLETPSYLGVQNLDGSTITLRVIAKVLEKDYYNSLRTLNREIILEFQKHHVIV